jgi:eukaryotic-like serine/threonine-protein kinase
MSRLLDQFDSDGALSGPLFESLAARLHNPVTELPAGHRVGVYRILHLLGRGGMAAVYLAERADGEFEQSVALKVAAGGNTAAERRDILRRERQILARLQHPHIARLLDGGTTDDGLLWFALEPVVGERIDRYCARHALSNDERVRLFLAVCDAVGFAHSQLLVHRDIKPTNIMVTADGDVKLLDFGIAGLLSTDASSSEAPQALSPGFASPEQLQGVAIGTGSDIWQLGRVLKAMLGADAASGASVGDADLEAIVAKAMRDQPGERYRSVVELAADLDRFLQRRPVEARNGGPLYRSARLVQRRRYTVLATVAAILVFAVMITHFTWRLTDERNAALHEAGRATAATEFLLRLFEVADPSVNRGDRLTANEILDSGVRRLRTDLVDQPALRAELLENIATVHITLGQQARAMEMLDESIALSRDRADVSAEELAYRLRQLARLKAIRADFVGALAAAEESESLLDDRQAHVDTRVRLLNTQAAIQARLGFYDRAIVIEQRAIGIADGRLSRDHPLKGHALNNIGTAYRGLRREQEAADAYAEAYRIIRSSRGEDHPDTYEIAGEYARQLARVGRYDEAMQLAAATHAGILHLFGEGNPRSAHSRGRLASIALYAGHYSQALEVGQQALKELRASADADALQVAMATRTVSEALLKLDRAAEAVPPLREAEQLQREKFAGTHIELADTRALLGSALCRSNQVQEGAAMIALALSAYRHSSFAESRARGARAEQNECL